MATHDGYVKIGQLQPQMQGVNLHMIVLEVGQMIRTLNGDTLQTIRVADSTGSIHFTLRIPELLELFQPGDILRLKNGYTNIFKGSLTLGCARMGECVRVGEFMMVYSEVPNMSDYNPQYAAVERARKGSPPEEGEVASTPVDPRRNVSGRGGYGGHNKRPYPAAPPNPPGAAHQRPPNGPHTGRPRP